MGKSDFTPKTIVRNKKDGTVGVICPDMTGPLNCNGPEEVGVVYDGTAYASGTDWHDLEVIGREEAIADLQKCGAGKGTEACCIFLTMSGSGPSCERFSGLRWTLFFRTMNAKRHPEKLFPNCQLA
jgi:hypothetical protein